MRYTHFPTPWDEQSSSQRVRFYTVLSSGHVYNPNLHSDSYAKYIFQFAFSNFMILEFFFEI